VRERHRWRVWGVEERGEVGGGGLEEGGDVVAVTAATAVRLRRKSHAVSIDG